MGNCICKSASEIGSAPVTKESISTDTSRVRGSLERYTQPPNNQGARVDVIRPANTTIVVALYPYQGTEHNDLNFCKGDRLLVLDDGDNDWWQARHLTTHLEGFIPRNFVATEKSVNTEDWFFENILRKDAENLLLQPHNCRGTFLIRNSEQQVLTGLCFSLSIKDWEPDRREHVKHYKIKRLDNGGYYITTKQTFATLQQLVAEYSRSANGLCHRLVVPCARPMPHVWDLSPETRDEWEIDPKELVFIRKLGSGNFGDVWYGKWRNKREVAIKSLKTGTMSSQAFLEEAAIMKTFRHNKLVSLYAVCSRVEPFYIVTEYMCNGSLLEYLRNGSGKLLTLMQLVDIIAQIAEGMKVLESKLLVHRDLSARNILVGVNNCIKIADFGLARMIEEYEYHARHGTKFPVKWTAPEAALYGKFTIKSDVWSYGIVMMEVVTYGQVPYPGMNSREVLDQVERGYRMPKPSSVECPDDIYDIMLKCWNANPNCRPTFDFLHAFFSDFQVSIEPRYRHPEIF